MRTYALLILSSALLFTAASAANASPALQANPSAGAAAPVQVADSSRPAPAAAATRTAPAAVAEEKKVCKQLGRQRIPLVGFPAPADPLRRRGDSFAVATFGPLPD